MKNLIFTITLLFISTSLFAQQRIISGVVSDDVGPVSDITVIVKGTSNGTITDFDGNYSIQAKTGDILIFSHISYSDVEKVVKKSNTINVMMNSSGESLDEIVVTAMAMKRERKVLGYSVSTIKSQSISQKLNGKVTGININSNNGTLIRGISSNGNKKPIYVLDGKIINERKFEKLNSNKIKSVNILKGYAATNIYGNKGANGVIVISTKEKTNNETYKEIQENHFENVQLSPLSTFSIDVDKASYSNIRRMLNNGEKIPTDAVKIEEMVNYFNYNYPQPKGEHPFSIITDVASSPINKEAKIVRIGLQGKKIENEKIPASNLVFLIDVSGSMSGQNKLPLLKSAFKLLTKQLRNKDKISIVVYAGAAGVVLESTSGDNKTKIIQALNNLNAGGSTAGGEGIELAYKIAKDNFIKNGNNRIILATDGDFNVGSSTDKSMEELIEEKRKSGIFLTCLGFGMGNYKDSKLEILADKGNGNHAYIDTMQEAKRVLGTEFGGTLYTIAKDVKIQVEFNPNKVQAYRLLGYENRMLEDKDFKDDTKDAGELGSNHNVTALYEIIPQGVKSDYIKNIDKLKYTETQINNNFTDELLTVKFRYKKPQGKKSIELIKVLKDSKTSFENANSNLKFSVAVASFGMMLRDSKYKNDLSYEDILKIAKQSIGKDKNGYRKEFINLVELAEISN